jgi:predicted alpha/beta hydrolase family esterase
MAGIIIVPGLGNSGALHWQTQWQQRLPNAERIELPQWQQPDLRSWVDAIIDAANRHDDSYIIAHSFGCLATVVALSQLHQRVRGILLVAPADPDKFKLADVLPQSALPVAGVMVGSLSDPWLTWGKAQVWAQRWELPIFCAGDAGHINIESGHGAWPEGWQLLEKLQQPRSIDLPSSLLQRSQYSRALAY